MAGDSVQGFGFLERLGPEAEHSRDRTRCGKAQRGSGLRQWKAEISSNGDEREAAGSFCSTKNAGPAEQGFPLDIRYARVHPVGLCPRIRGSSRRGRSERAQPLPRSGWVSTIAALTAPPRLHFSTVFTANVSMRARNLALQG